MKRFITMIGSGVLILLIIGTGMRYFFSNGTRVELPLQVRLESPLNGAIIYADTLAVIGTTTHPITLQAELWIDDQLLIGKTDDFLAGEWDILLSHHYVGDPTEANLRLIAPETGDIYQESVIVISHPSERPEGVWGRVIAPMVGADIGGDYVVVQGRISGIVDEVITVQLLDDRQTVLDQQTITVHNGYRIDDLPFQVEVAIKNVVGLALIHITFEQLELEETIPINLVGVAG